MCETRETSAIIGHVTLTEMKVESGTSQSKSGTSVKSSDSGVPGRDRKKKTQTTLLGYEVSTTISNAKLRRGGSKGSKAQAQWSTGVGLS